MGTNRTCRVKRLRCSVRRTQKIAQDFPGTETAYTCASPWIFREGLAATGVEDALQHSDRPDFQAVVAPYGSRGRQNDRGRSRGASSLSVTVTLHNPLLTLLRLC